MNFDNSLPIYLQLAKEWRHLIVSGQWPAGSKMESVRELAQVYGVNPNTVQRALNELESEGLAKSHRTLGRYITEDGKLIRQSKENLARELIWQLGQEIQALDISRDFLVDQLEQLFDQADLKKEGLDGEI